MRLCQSPKINGSPVGAVALNGPSPRLRFQSSTRTLLWCTTQKSRQLLTRFFDLTGSPNFPRGNSIVSSIDTIRVHAFGQQSFLRNEGSHAVAVTGTCELGRPRVFLQPHVSDCQNATPLYDRHTLSIFASHTPLEHPFCFMLLPPPFLFYEIRTHE